jgi:AcrR family transcriptional regulator
MESPKRAATHAANRARVLEVARCLLAKEGAAGLSLREIAREMDQASSALYRYFANRDELLTALIIDAYNDLGSSVEEAEAKVDRSDLEERFRVAGRAVREWAISHPHEYGLIFGTPVPGYVAPEATVAAATRVPHVLIGIVIDRFQELPAHTHDGRIERALQWETIEKVMPHAPPAYAFRAIMVWTHLFGFVNFEIFGHFEGSVQDPAMAFELTLDELLGMLRLARENINPLP